MKCPKCGYNSFDHLEACKKCGNHLLTHRTRFGLKSLFFGGADGDPELPRTAETESAKAERDEETPTHFGFDFMPEESSGDLPSASPRSDDEPESGSPAGSEQAAANSDTSGEPNFGEANDELPDPFAPDSFEKLAPFEPASENDFFAETFAQSAPEDWATEDGNDLLEFAPFAEEAAFSEAERVAESAATTVETAPPLDKPLSSAALSGEDPADLGSGKKSGDLLAAEMQEEDGFGEANLAEMFLESLDAEETIAEPPQTAPFGFHEADPFGDVSADVPLMEGNPREREAGGEASEEPEVGIGEGARAGEQPGEARPPALSPRFGAAAVDLGVLAVVFLLFLAAGEAASGAAHDNGIFPSLPRLLDLAGPYFLVFFASCFGYFTLFHFLLGQTPGKMLFRLKVVAEDGEALLLSQAFLRSVGGLLSLLPAGLGYLRILVDARRRGWNDRLADSCVVSLPGGEDSPEAGENHLQAAETE